MTTTSSSLSLSKSTSSTTAKSFPDNPVVSVAAYNLVSDSGCTTRLGVSDDGVPDVEGDCSDVVSDVEEDDCCDVTDNPEGDNVVDIGIGVSTSK